MIQPGFLHWHFVVRMQNHIELGSGKSLSYVIISETRIWHMFNTPNTLCVLYMYIYVRQTLVPWVSTNKSTDLISCTILHILAGVRLFNNPNIIKLQKKQVRILRIFRRLSYMEQLTIRTLWFNMVIMVPWIHHIFKN